MKGAAAPTVLAFTLPLIDVRRTDTTWWSVEEPD